MFRPVTTVSSDALRMGYVDGGGRRGSITATFEYDARDPYAVTLRFAGRRGITWVFGRDLLIEGLDEPAGDGDVHVWSDRDLHDLRVVNVELCSPDGHLLLTAPYRDTARFVRRMLDLVPRGQESGHLDLDRAVQVLLDSHQV